MPNDWTIAGVGGPAGPSVPDPPQAKADATPEPVGGGSALPNPTLRLDPSLGIVVIEFLNSAGQVANSIPTQQQLEAYRMRAEASSKKAQTGEQAAAPAAKPEPPAPSKAKPSIVA
jgi:hypothetical protein